MKTFEFRGLPIRYVREGAGEPVVFLHNGGTSHAIWKDVLPRIARRREVFALDLLGFGASAKPEQGYSLDDYEAMLAAFVDSVVRAPLSLVGNCMGSAISLRVAMSRPREVRALVLINPLTEATFLGGSMGTLLRMRKAAPGLMRPVQRGISGLRLPELFAKESLRFQVGEEGRRRGVHEMDDLCACAASDSHMKSLVAVFDDLVSYGVIDRFVPDEAFPPICTIWGLENRVLSPEAGRRLNATLRPRREHWLAGCGHLLMLEKPDEVGAIIEDALDAFVTGKAATSGQRA